MRYVSKIQDRLFLYIVQGRLVNTTEPQGPAFDERRIRSRLGTCRLGKSLVILEHCTSTNDVAAECALRGAPDGFTVLADSQTEGRGRFARKWVSPRGGVWLTVVIRTESANLSACLPLLGALATVHALEIHDVPAFVRWPNDVVVRDKKLAGILVEARSHGGILAFALVGIGINANFRSTELHEFADKSTSILDIMGSPVDRSAIVCDVLLALESLCDRVTSGATKDILELLKRKDCSRGKTVMIAATGPAITGTIEDYVDLTSVRITAAGRADAIIETASVVSVQYVAD